MIKITFVGKPQANMASTSYSMETYVNIYREPQIRKQSLLLCLEACNDAFIYHINNNSFLHFQPNVRCTVHETLSQKFIFAEKPLFILCTLLHY